MTSVVIDSEVYPLGYTLSLRVCAFLVYYMNTTEITELCKTISNSIDLFN